MFKIIYLDGTEKEFKSLVRAMLGGANLKGADLRDANLKDACLGYADLEGANLIGANLRDADLTDTNLKDACLGYADLEGANLIGANLRNANLIGANLRGANLRNANLIDADLRSANLEDANLEDANLEKTFLYKEKIAVFTKTKKILYLDMDNVLVDFNGSPNLKDWDKTKTNPPQMYENGFFESLNPVSGAISSVEKIINSNKYDVHILTQPVATSPISYTEKANWVLKYLPSLGGKITMTQDKSLIKGDFLIDDNKKWESFEGEFLHFKIDIPPIEMWNKILQKLEVK